MLACRVMIPSLTTRFELADELILLLFACVGVRSSFLHPRKIESRYKEKIKLLFGKKWKGCVFITDGFIDKQFLLIPEFLLRYILQHHCMDFL